MIEVKAVAALLCRDNNGTPEYLSVSRKLDHTLKGLPGGRIEPGEDPAQALIRELHEETGLIVQVFDLLYDGIDFDGTRCQTFHVACWTGEEKSSETGVIEWLPHEHFTNEATSPFASYNRALFTVLGVM